MACLVAVVLSVGGLTGAPLVIGGSLILGLVMALFPAIAQKTMTKITGTEDIGFGHFSTIGYWFAAQVGKLTSSKARKEGRTVKSTEDINFPQRVSFMRDNTVAISITMMVLFLIVTGVASTKSGFADLDTNYVSGGYTNWFTYALVTGMNFAGGIYIILSGVRMILAEIVPAFKGIADKLVPNAKPAIDCPVVFPYAPNAVLIGFIVSFVGGIVGMFILFGIKGAALAAVPIILPGVVPHFFCGATAGIYGNATGGRRGAAVGAFLNGLAITFLPALALPVLGQLGFQNTTFGDADFAVIGLVLGNAFEWIGMAGIYGVVVIAALVLIIPNFIKTKGKVINYVEEE